MRLRERLADVDGDDVGALLGQPHRVAAALAARGAGDERDLALEPTSHANHSRTSHEFERPLNIVGWRMFSSFSARQSGFAIVRPG